MVQIKNAVKGLHFRVLFGELLIGGAFSSLFAVEYWNIDYERTVDPKAFSRLRSLVWGGGRAGRLQRQRGVARELRQRRALLAEVRQAAAPRAAAQHPLIPADRHRHGPKAFLSLPAYLSTAAKSFVLAKISKVTFFRICQARSWKRNSGCVPGRMKLIFGTMKSKIRIQRHSVTALNISRCCEPSN